MYWCFLFNYMLEFITESRQGGLSYASDEKLYGRNRSEHNG
jgi:hypothetical protein